MYNKTFKQMYAESITKGNPIYLYNSKVRNLPNVYRNTNVLFNPQSANSQSTSIAMAKLSDNVIITVALNNTGSNCYVKVFSYNSNPASVSNTLTFSSTGLVNVCRLSDTTALIVYTTGSGVYNFYVITYSGGSISAGTIASYTLATGGTGSPTLTLYNTNKVLVSWSVAGSTNAVVCVTALVTGTTVDVTNTRQVSMAVTGLTNGITGVNASTTKCILGYGRAVANNGFNVVVVTINGSDIPSFGTPVGNPVGFLYGYITGYTPFLDLVSSTIVNCVLFGNIYQFDITTGTPVLSKQSLSNYNYTKYSVEPLTYAKVGNRLISVLGTSFISTVDDIFMESSNITDLEPFSTSQTNNTILTITANDTTGAIAACIHAASGGPIVLYLEKQSDIYVSQINQDTGATFSDVGYAEETGTAGNSYFVTII